MDSKSTEKPEKDRQGPDESGPDEPLDLAGYETMQQTFGTGTSRRVVLVGKPVTLNELVRIAR